MDYWQKDSTSTTIPPTLISDQVGGITIGATPMFVCVCVLFRQLEFI